MERFFAASQDSPLLMLRMLENNLRRERRIFAIAVGLLMFAALCGAVATAIFMVSASLKTEQEVAQAVMRNVNVSVFSRFDMLGPGSLLLEIGVVAPKQGVPDSAAKAPCKPYPSGREDSALAAACQAARQMIPQESTLPILQYAFFDGTASHGFGFFTDTADNRQPTALPLSLERRRYSRARRALRRSRPRMRGTSCGSSRPRR